MPVPACRLALLLLLTAGASSRVCAQIGPVIPEDAPARYVHGLRLYGAEIGIGLMAGAVALSFDALGGEGPLHLYLLTPVVGAPLGSYVVVRLTGVRGSFAGAARGAFLAGSPGLLVAGTALIVGDPSLEILLLVVGLAAYAGGSVIGATLGYNDTLPRLHLVRLPAGLASGNVAPGLRLRF